MIIYIGDGLSDTCPVHIADMVFAKGSLASYCNQHGIIHHNWNSFFDIISVLKKRKPVLRDIARKERRKVFIAE
jgi:2-hydroxy-3-keto-5-methylthiopentenyl-1-phosphate phosphatase